MSYDNYICLYIYQLFNYFEAVKDMSNNDSFDRQRRFSFDR